MKFGWDVRAKYPGLDCEAVEERSNEHGNGAGQAKDVAGSVSDFYPHAFANSFDKMELAAKGIIVLNSDELQEAANMLAVGYAAVKRIGQLRRLIRRLADVAYDDGTLAKPGALGEARALLAAIGDCVDDE